MKRRMLCMLTALLLMLLPALAEEEVQGEANAAYAAVLLEGAAYAPLEEDMRAAWNAVRFAVLDLDENGVAEVIVEVTEPEAYIILSYDGGKVYATEWPYRGLLDLKDDGTFSFSSGASFNGVARMLLQGDGQPQWGYLPLAESYTGEDDAIHYALDGGAQSTDEAGFNAVLTAQENKLPALWYDYTEENLKLLLGLQ